MDLEDQATVEQVVQELDRENTVVLLGQPDPNSSLLFAETVTSGDPTWAGPLAGVSLGLPVYHVLEPEIKRLVPPELYQEHVGLMEMAAEVEKIVRSVSECRAKSAHTGGLGKE
jgi:betaine reductase